MTNHEETAVSRDSSSLLLMVGLSLLAGVAIDFAPQMIWHDQQRIEQLVLLVIMSLAVTTVWRKKLIVSLACLPGLSRLALGGTFVLGGVSAALSAFPRFAGLEWTTVFLLLMLTVILAGEARQQSARFDRRAKRLVVALAVVIAIKSMMGYLASITEGLQLDTLALFEGTFSNRRVFGQVASMVIPLLAYPLLGAEMSRVQRWSLFAVLAVWWMLVIVSGTRGTWMALAVAAIVLVAFAWRASAGWLRIQALALGVGALSFGILFVWLPIWIGLDVSLENRLINLATLSGREVLWSLAWAQMQAHPWLGIGPMHLAAIHNDFGAHPHNAVLQLAAEWGMPATLALVLTAVVGLLRLLARLRQNEHVPNVLLVCLTASLLAAAAQSMVDGVIVIPFTQTMLAFVVGWTLGVYFGNAVVTPPVPYSSLMRSSISVLSFFALVALLNGVFPEAFNRPEITQIYVDAGRPIPPRYWGVGWIPGE